MTFIKNATDATHVVVPEGHLVRGYDLLPEPQVQRCEGGLVIGHFGFGGDDADEVFDVVHMAASELDRLGTEGSTVTLVAAPLTVSGLFLPELPATITIQQGVAWTVRQDGLWSVLQDAALRKRLLSEFDRSPFKRQWLVVDSTWRSDPDFEDALRALGVKFVQSSGAHPFLLQVSRPDGLCVCGFVDQELVPAPPGGPRPLLRSTRLPSRILQEFTLPTTSDSFYEQLMARRSPLVFLVGGGGKRPLLMGFPEAPGPHLPVFSDLRSAQRTAKETGLEPGTYGLGALDARELFRWAKDDRFGLALGAFPDEGGVRYIVLDVSRTDPRGSAAASASASASATKRTESPRRASRSSLLAVAIVALLGLTDLGLMFTTADRAVMRLCMVMFLLLALAGFIAHRRFGGA
jgi:hypothetical protein